MEEQNLDQYKRRINEIVQSLLDVIASVSHGDYDVKINIPNDVEILAELASGLELLIDDSRKLAQEQENLRFELEQRVLERTRELEIALENLQATQRQLITEGWNEYTQYRKEVKGLTLRGISETEDEEWLPGMIEAVEQAKVTYDTNGQDAESLSIPIQLQDEIVGVLGFNRDTGRPWSELEISTVEAIVEQVGLALENQRLFEVTQDALTETESLYQANRELNTVQTYTDVLGVLQRYTILHQQPLFLSINLFDQPWTNVTAPTCLVPIGQWATSNEYLFDDAPLMFSDWPQVTEYLDPDSITILEDSTIMPEMGGIFRDVILEKQKTKMLITAPLVSAGQWIGQVLASFPTPIEVTDDDKRQLLGLAGQAAVAIQNLNLLDETARRASQLETAANIARQSSSMLDPNALLSTAVNLIRDRFGFYHASIFLIEGPSAIVRASTGEAGKQMVTSGHKLLTEEGASIIGQVCFSGEALIVNDVTQNPTHRPHPLLPDTRAELGLPLMIGGRVIGALDVQSTKVNAFSEDDVAVLQTLADQIAVALENARSFEVAQRAVVEIQEADRLKSEFLANMSHELRTPLNSIIGFSRVILKGIDGPITDLQQQDLEAIHHSGQHLLDMINNLLDLSKIEAGKMELSIEEIELSDVIESAISTARGLIKEQPIQLVENVPDKLPPVLVDRTRIRQIMLNLLQNATKFTDEGTITIDVEIIEDVETAKPFIKISVSDTGIGIATEDQKSLFERFSQVDSSLTRKVGGTGLGLSISKHLVEMQGGTIGLTSEIGKGSTFWFTVPVATAAPVIEVIDKITQADVEEIHDKSTIVESKEEDSVDKAFESEQAMLMSKIIVSIDDDAKVISLYQRYLSPHGYQVVPLTDPTKAIDQIRDIKPYAITLDIMMPNKDGWQVIQDIKSDPELNSIPIIICSITENREKAYKLGAVDYLVKPILEEELVTAIKNLSLSEDRTVHDILVIDDDPDVLQLIKATLRDEATYRIQYANGGFNGLEKMKERRPDALILDLVMPDLDGFSILETMQGDQELRSIPVIILTAADLSIEERTQIEKYKRNFLQKGTFRGNELIDFLENALEKIDKQGDE
ncbi:MAG: response regulator [Anaerolineales bacterium]|jgi:signal transduction histidine kinase/CheY-like chemotaxis protein